MCFLHHLTPNLNPTQGHTRPWQTAQCQKEGREKPKLSAPPGLKALMVACFFPLVPKNEGLVVIRRHLFGVCLEFATQIQALELCPTAYKMRA